MVGSYRNYREVADLCIHMFVCVQCWPCDSIIDIPAPSFITHFNNAGRLHFLGCSCGEFVGTNNEVVDDVQWFAS